MNYQKIYNEIVNKRNNIKYNGYTETHHIVPKSLNGTNDKSNLVDLSAREHFICHLLLTKMYPEGSVEWIKMVKAFINMFRFNKDNQKRYCPSRWYEYCRKNVAKANSKNQAGSGNSQYGKRWIINPHTQQVKSVSLEVLDTFLKQGWLRGRTLNRNNRYLNGKYIKLSEEQKQRNKLARHRKKEQNPESKLYQVTNKISNQRKFVTEQELLNLNEDWVSLHYQIDENIVKDLFRQGYKIQQIADYFGMSYHNFYSWYRSRKQTIQKELPEVFSKFKICPICGKQFKRSSKKIYCSKQCYSKACSQRIWVKKDGSIKHILKSELQQYENNGWNIVKPIPGKSSQEWN